MTNWEISGWRPAWMHSRLAIIAKSRRVRTLVGQQVEQAWVAWDQQHNHWFPDLPVVLRFDSGDQLEVCWQKLDDLSLTWNTIDTTVAPVAWVTWPLDWRSTGHPALDPFVGQRLSDVTLTEHLFTFTTSPEDRTPGNPTDPSSAVWLPSGLWLASEDSGLYIYNALDENGLSIEEPEAGPELRLTAI